VSFLGEDESVHLRERRHGGKLRVDGGRAINVGEALALAAAGAGAGGESWSTFMA